MQSELQLLQAWLDENALGQYFNACVANGYDSLKTVEELDEEEFKEFCQIIGFLAGHRVKAKKLWPYISDFRLQNQMLLQKKEAEAKEAAEKAKQIKTVQVYRYVMKPNTAAAFYAYYFSDSPTSFKDIYVPGGDKHKSFLGVTADHPDAVPIYASYLANSGFCFTPEKPGTADNGWTSVGIVFYLLKTQVIGSVPIHRVAHKTPKYREYINRTGKSADGWDVQGILGYGFPNNIKHDDVVLAPYNPQGVKKEQVYRYVIAPPTCAYYAYCITNKTTPLKPTYSPDGNSYKAFMGVTADTPNSVPIYVSHNDGAGFCFLRGAPGSSNGWNNLGVQFYLLKNPAPGTVTIFKQSNAVPVYREIALTTNAEAGGWTNKSILGYAYTSNNSNE